MEIKFFCPRWGFDNVDWERFLVQVQEAAYAGIEWFPQGSPEEISRVTALLERHNLDHSIVMEVSRPWTSIDQYLQYLQEDLARLLHIGAGSWPPLFLSVQAGREYFTADQIAACIRICEEAAQLAGIPVFLETHRNKWNYAAHVTLPVLQQHPDLPLTLDISHWYCVSESYLHDQAEAVETAIRHTQHIHARVGHTEGPQVSDPALPEYQEALQEHLSVWDRWVADMAKRGREYVSITPEFGPFPYLALAGRSLDPQAEQWRLNLWMKNLLENRYIHYTNE